MTSHYNFNKGFTLIELLVVVTIIGLISAGVVLLVTNVMQRSKFDITTKRMDDLKNAIIGNPTLITNNVRTDFGYVGDMGRLPASLLELTTQGAQPAWNSTTQCGWHGPYIRSPFQEDASAYSRDGWGNNFSYNNTTGVITSTGSDGATGGSDWASDINSEAINGLITNSVTVKVFDKSGNGATGATITVYYPNNGTETNTSYVLLTVDAGMHTFNSIPTGMRKIIVTFSGETYTKWVAVEPTITVSVDYKIITSSKTPNAPTGLTATPLSTKQINLNWTAPTQNTDGTTLTDLASYDIYRGISSGTETFLVNTGNKNTNFADTGLMEAQTYYYKVSALNEGGSFSAQSTEINAKAGPIQQNVAINPGFGVTDRFRTIGIRNYGNTIITVATMQLTWTVSANPRDLDRIRIGTGGSWTTVWSSGSGVTTPTDVLSLSTTYDLSTGVNYQIELRYENLAGPDLTLTSLTIRMNTSDGLLIVYD